MKNVTPKIQRTNEFKKQTVATLFAIGALVALILAILWPLGTIWAMNALFNLNIQYTFTNWLACVVLILTLQATLKISKTPIEINTTNNGKQS